MITNPTNARKCTKVYYTCCISPTCFGHSCGHFPGHLVFFLKYSFKIREGVLKSCKIAGKIVSLSGFLKVLKIKVFKENY